MDKKVLAIVGKRDVYGNFQFRMHRQPVWINEGREQNAICFACEGCIAPSNERLCKTPPWPEKEHAKPMIITECGTERR